MGFDTIPAIPADYPLYDWADWQSSRDALAPGVKTKQFQIAAWNAIVDSLANAINAAGQEWDTSYTTAAGAKITALDPKLYARKYNSIRLNIDRQMHLEWPWAEDSAFRGYVGREDFLGREDVGKDCDKVYPEYILELVRKLNLLLDIMRGGDLIRYADTQHISGTLIELSMYSGAGDHIQYSHNTQVLCISSAFTGRGSGISGNAMSVCKQSADANTGIGSQFRFSSISQVLVGPMVNQNHQILLICRRSHCKVTSQRRRFLSSLCFLMPHTSPVLPHKRTLTQNERYSSFQRVQL